MPKVKSLLFEVRREIDQLDARLLLQYVTGLTHTEIIADPEHDVSQAQAISFRTHVKRRIAGEPVSRILGVREFYGRSFRVTPAVLDPRADTETLIDAALTLPKPQSLLDLGTGSGILAVTLLAEIPSATGVCVDLSQEALEVARENAAAHGVVSRLQFIHGSWFQSVHGRFDLIVSNPPYIPSQDISTLEIEVRGHDPHLALDGGEDGLNPYRAIATGVAHHMNQRAHVLVEIGAGQAGDVTAIFAKQGFHTAGQWRDLGGHIRAVAFNMP